MRVLCEHGRRMLPHEWAHVAKAPERGSGSLGLRIRHPRERLEGDRPHVRIAVSNGVHHHGARVRRERRDGSDVAECRDGRSAHLRVAVARRGRELPLGAPGVSPRPA